MADAILRKKVTLQFAAAHGYSVLATTTTPIKALHHDRGRMLVSRDTTRLERPRRVNWIVRARGGADELAQLWVCYSLVRVPHENTHGADAEPAGGSISPPRRFGRT